MTMLDWNPYQKQQLTNIGQIGKISPDTVRGYQQLSGARNKRAKLDAKTRELIALAVAVTRHAKAARTSHQPPVPGRSPHRASGLGRRPNVVVGRT
jgi:Carboxymuconolactone decarboxylase family